MTAVRVMRFLADQPLGLTCRFVAVVATFMVVVVMGSL